MQLIHTYIHPYACVCVSLDRTRQYKIVITLRTDVQQLFEIFLIVAYNFTIELVVCVWVFLFCGCFHLSWRSDMLCPCYWRACHIVAGKFPRCWSKWFDTVVGRVPDKECHDDLLFWNCFSDFGANIKELCSVNWHKWCGRTRFRQIVTS